MPAITLKENEQDIIEDIVSTDVGEIKIDSQDSPFIQAIKILHANSILPKAEIKSIATLPKQARAFFPSVEAIDKELNREYRLNLALLQQKKIRFKDIKAITRDDHPLLDNQAKIRIHENNTTLFHELNEQILAEEIFLANYYQQLITAIKQHIARISRSFRGEGKAKTLNLALKEIEQQISNGDTNSLSPYDFLKQQTQNRLLDFFNSKRIGFSQTTSYVAISQLISKLDQQILENRRYIATKPQKENISHKYSLGNILIIKLMKIRTQPEAFDIIRELNYRQKIHFINQYRLTFEPEIPYDTLFDDADESLVNDHLKTIFIKIQQQPATDTELQKKRWRDVLVYTLAPIKPSFSNAFDCPVPPIENPTVANIAETISQNCPMDSAIFQGEKNGGAHGAGELGGIYLRCYTTETQKDGKTHINLHLQKSLIKQATTDQGKIRITDNMRECWGGMHIHRLAPDNNAPIRLTAKPNGVPKKAEDVYLESTYLNDFISAEKAAQQSQRFRKNPSKRAAGKNLGQHIDNPRVIYGLGNSSDFKKGIKKFVKKHHVSKASFARAIMPRLLLGDNQTHFNNVGFTRINGQYEFASLDFGGSGRRPYDSRIPCHLKNKEVPGEFSSIVDPFKGKDKKYGTSYARSFPLEFYCDIDFIEESLKILNTYRQNVEQNFNEILEDMQQFYQDEDILEHLANSYKTYDTATRAEFKFSSLAEFKDFYIYNALKRMKSARQFILELDLWRIASSQATDLEKRRQLSQIFKDNLEYKLDVSAPKDSNGKYHFYSKTLRTLYQETPNASHNAQLILHAYRQVSINSNDLKEVKWEAVEQACEEYCEAKRKVKNGLGRYSDLFKRLMHLNEGKKSNVSLSNQDRQDIATLIHQHKEKTTSECTSRAPIKTLTQAIFGRENYADYYEHLMAMPAPDFKEHLNRFFPVEPSSQMQNGQRPSPSSRSASNSQLDNFQQSTGSFSDQRNNKMDASADNHNSHPEEIPASNTSSRNQHSSTVLSPVASPLSRGSANDSDLSEHKDNTDFPPHSHNSDPEEIPASDTSPSRIQHSPPVSSPVASPSSIDSANDSDLKQLMSEMQASIQQLNQTLQQVQSENQQLTRQVKQLLTENQQLKRQLATLQAINQEPVTPSASANRVNRSLSLGQQDTSNAHAKENGNSGPVPPATGKPNDPQNFSAAAPLQANSREIVINIGKNYAGAAASLLVSQARPPTLGQQSSIKSQGQKSAHATAQPAKHKSNRAGYTRVH